MFKKLLVVDDVEINREMLKVIFEEQFDVLEAENGQEAIDILEEHSDSISLMFLDLLMPVKSGFEVLAFMKEKDLIDKIPVVVITAENTVESDIQVYEHGAADIIYKPFSRRVVTRRTLNIIELYESRNNMQELLDIRTEELRKLKEKADKTNEFLVNAMVSVLEQTSFESRLHVNRVKKFTDILLHTWVALHPDAKLTEHDIEQIVNASALHDIGKIGIPDEILMKPTKLTREELDVLKEHTTMGCEILERFKQEESEFYQYCYDISKYHHERYDGKGFPEGLKGEEIPLWAQVVSLAVTYDEMVNPTIKKVPYAIPEALRSILSEEEGSFSKELLKCLETAKFEIIKATEEEV